MPIIRARDLGLRYEGQDEWALQSVSLEWRPGEIVLLIGPAGSGKSSLGKLLKGVLAPSAGTIEIVENETARAATPSELLKLVGWSDCQPERQIFASTVREEISFGPIQAGLSTGEVSDRVFKSLSVIGLDSPSFAERNPLALSGGEKRRVALAGIVAVESKFYLFDEPAAGLDPRGIDRIREIIWKLAEQAAGVVIITHDPAEIADICDTIWKMERGRLTEIISVKKADWNAILEWLENGREEARQ